MKLVVQRASRSQVQVGGEVISTVGPGLIVFLGVARGDSKKDADFLVEKVLSLRIFEDEEGKMNRSLLDCGGGIMVISQFTLLADCRKGRRPSFGEAEEPKRAEELYCYFVTQVKSRAKEVGTGKFGASMVIDVTMDGPVTILLESNLTPKG